MDLDGIVHGGSAGEEPKRLLYPEQMSTKTRQSAAARSNAIRTGGGARFGFQNLFMIF
jgi:hypothetical protein